MSTFDDFSVAQYIRKTVAELEANRKKLRFMQDRATAVKKTYVSLPEVVTAEFDEHIEELGGPPGFGRPGYRVYDSSGRSYPVHKDRFERRHLIVPDGVAPEKLVDEIDRFVGQKVEQ